MRTNWWLWTKATALIACFLAHAGRGICEETTFTPVHLATQEDHSWGDVQVGDLNGDGKLDIQAGKQWYEGPDWVRHSFGPNPGNIYGTGQCLLYDVDADGDLDILGTSTATATWMSSGGNATTLIETPGRVIRLTSCGSKASPPASPGGSRG